MQSSGKIAATKVQSPSFETMHALSMDMMQHVTTAWYALHGRASGAGSAHVQRDARVQHCDGVVEVAVSDQAAGVDLAIVRAPAMLTCEKGSQAPVVLLSPPSCFESRLRTYLRANAGVIGDRR